jgi:hypothetical protein
MTGLHNYLDIVGQTDVFCLLGFTALQITLHVLLPIMEQELFSSCNINLSDNENTRQAFPVLDLHNHVGIDGDVLVVIDGPTNQYLLFTWVSRPSNNIAHTRLHN